MEKLKYIKLYDVFSSLLFFIVLPIALIYRVYLKIRKRKIWLITEYKDSARDNGYCFFKYIMENKKEQECYYAIDKKCKDYDKLKMYKNIVQFGSLKHWILYMSVDKNISTIKDCSPNHLLFSIIHQKLNLFNNVVFLQHGVILNRLPMFYYKNTKFKLFICGAKDEFDDIRKNYGYPDENVVYTGLARYDNLINYNVIKNQILIIPTWRRWLGRETNVFSKNVNFTDTQYCKCWNKLLKNKKFCEYIEKNDIKVKFYPHKGMQKYINYFNVKCKNIEIVDIKKEDIQQLLKESVLMVTDYSSVCTDFAFMKKPIIFYQFDREEFFTKHVDRGYFDYKRDGFGPVLENESDIVDNIIKCIENKYKVEERYINKMVSFFPLQDNKNCERIFNEIKRIS